METHWIPADPALWRIENYDTFLEQRRILLAQAANGFLASLYGGSLAAIDVQSYATRQNVELERSEEDEIDDMSAWMSEHGLNEGTVNHELLDANGNIIALVDLAWPHGIQSGLSEPVALLLNETAETQAAVSQSGYRYYTSTKDLKDFISSVYLS